MKNLIIAIVLITMSSTAVTAQKYLTKNGHINFFSEAPLEKIEADNNQVTSIMDLESGEIVFSLLLKGFHFEKALMEEHFNEKYIHSDKYPKSTFKGSIEGLKDQDFTSEEPLLVSIKGELTLHGVTKEIATEATLKMEEDKIYAKAEFPITLSEFDIKIPGVVKDNISKIVEVTVTMIYDAYNQ